MFYQLRAWFLNLPDRVKWFFQRVFRGYDDPGWWDIEISLARWIIPRLKHLREHTHGYPPGVGGEESWDKILGKIILAFELIVEMLGEDTNLPPIRDQIDEGLDLFRKWYFNLWD